jgi:hypothetical protein
MKLSHFFVASFLALVAANGASAQSTPDELGLGNHEPKPEKVGKIGNDIFIRARLIREKSGELAAKVKQGEIVSVELDYLAADGAKDRPISLVCSVQFIDLEGQKSDSSITGKPCREGRLQDYGGRYDSLAIKLRFRPETSDPAGTNGVIVRVEDTFSGKRVTLVPTYDWVDGKK